MSTRRSQKHFPKFLYSSLYLFWNFVIFDIYKLLQIFSFLPFFLSLSQIPYLGFCACGEMGETGVWQLVDPPILPLTHGPNHSFNWRETLLQD